MPVMRVRYYFNLTDGDEMISDEDGIVLSDIHAALLYAMNAIGELRAEEPSASNEWRGWSLVIVDASRRTVQSISLEAPSCH
jgi:hypothetical protein